MTESNDTPQRLTLVAIDIAKDHHGCRLFGDPLAQPVQSQILLQY